MSKIIHTPLGCFIFQFRLVYNDLHTPFKVVKIKS